MPIPSDVAQSDGDVMRRLVDVERKLRELAAGRRMESAVIGSGGITVRGGSIVIQTPDGLVDLAVLSSDGIFFNGEPLLLPGSVCDFAGPSANIPAGWLICDGAAVSRTTYAQLFAAIGTTWGVGDGSTTFNLPDQRDRNRVGAGSTYAVGATGGAATHQHAATGDHLHTMADTGSESAHTHTQGITGNGSTHSHGIGDTGSASASHTHTIPTGTDVTVPNIPGGGAFTASGQNHTHGGTNASSSTAHAHTNPNTDNESAHNHTNPTTAAGSSHSHTTPDMSTTGSHQHAAASSLAPYGAFITIIRT